VKKKPTAKKPATKPAATKPVATKPVATKASSSLDVLAARFGLDGDERRVLELVRAADQLTVRELRAKVAGADALLSPKRALRRHALVTVGAGGLPMAMDAVRLAPGVAQRLDGAPEPDSLWLGMCRVSPGARGDVPSRISAIFTGINGASATLLTLDGCARREAHELALGLARHLGRGVLLVDGELAADAPDRAALLASARREADCEGDVLVVCESAALGEYWRALIAPPTGEASALIVLADAARTREPIAAAPFTVRRLSLHPAATTTAPAAEARAEEKAPPPVDDGLEHIRQQAIRDAERALGIFRAPPPPPRAPVTPIPPPTKPQAAHAAAAPQAAAPPPTVTQAAAPPPASPTQPAKKRSAKGAQFFGGETTADTPPPPAPAPPPPATPSIENDGAPVAVADNAGPDELARIATTSPSAAQRIELINRLRTIKSAAVVAALRANAGSQHPAVRAAAEAAMATMFGPNWNATRAIPKPVQPPPSDDKDRGPPGGW